MVLINVLVLIHYCELFLSYLHQPVQVCIDCRSGEIFIDLYDRKLVIRGHKYFVSMVQQTGKIHSSIIQISIQNEWELTLD